MKKVLFASTALVAAGLMTTGTASAAEKIKLELGGYSKWWVVGAWNDSNFEAMTGNANSYNNVDVKGDNEIWFTGSTTLDNGLKVGITIELEAGGHAEALPRSTTTGDIIDASFVWVESGFGKIMLGAHNNGAWLLHTTAPDAAGNVGPEGVIMGGLAVPKPTNVTTIGLSGALQNTPTTGLITDDKAEKITYVSPSFGGLTVGASYIPNIAQEDNRVPAANDTEVFGAGALYANTFGGVGVKLSAGIISYDPGALATQNERGYEYSAGTQISYAGFTVGGSYRRAWENQNGGFNNNVSTASGAGHAWDAGIMYATGPYAVSFYYYRSETVGMQNTANQTINGGEDTVEIYQVSGKYTMSPGVDILATVGHASFKDGDRPSVSTGDGNNNDGWAVMTGLSLQF